MRVPISQNRSWFFLEDSAERGWTQRNKEKWGKTNRTFALISSDRKIFRFNWVLWCIFILCPDWTYNKILLLWWIKNKTTKKSTQTPDLPWSSNWFLLRPISCGAGETYAELGICQRLLTVALAASRLRHSVLKQKKNKIFRLAFLFDCCLKKK